MEKFAKAIGGLLGCALYVFWGAVAVGIFMWVCGYGGIRF